MSVKRTVARTVSGSSTPRVLTKRSSSGASVLLEVDAAFSGQLEPSGARDVRGEVARLGTIRRRMKEKRGHADRAEDVAYVDVGHHAHGGGDRARARGEPPTPRKRSDELGVIRVRGGQFRFHGARRIAADHLDAFDAVAFCACAMMVSTLASSASLVATTSLPHLRWPTPWEAQNS